MYPYLPHTDEDIKKMLSVIGVSQISDLFTDIPEELRYAKPLNLDASLSELEVEKKLRGLAALNESTKEKISFLGAGAYEHYIPAIIKHLTLRQEFFTAYTPYQPEISQGTLQAIFEYQTMICELTCMDASNASLYDGGCALAEAVFMANHGNNKTDVLVSKTVNPQYREVIATYAKYNQLNYIEINDVEGITDITHLKTLINGSTSSVVIQTPNYYGLVEDGMEIRNTLDHLKSKAEFIVSVNPISLGIFEAPGNYGADIVTGEGQSLGNPIQFGGPYLGFIATTKKNMRRLPGRIVGQTVDKDGKRAFVLTLQAREQHIRREKAMSNITSNQGLNALVATIYLATIGKKGLIEVAKQCVFKAHYLAKELSKIQGIGLLYNKPFFHEFVIETSKDAQLIYNELYKKGYYAGVVVEKNKMLLCVTEIRTKDEMDRFVQEMEVAVG